jgi:hypothetical protein
VNHFGDDATGGHDAVAALQSPQRCLVLFPLLLLWPDHQEIENGENEAELKNQRREARDTPPSAPTSRLKDCQRRKSELHCHSVRSPVVPSVARVRAW